MPKILVHQRQAERRDAARAMVDSSQSELVRNPVWFHSYIKGTAGPEGCRRKPGIGQSSFELKCLQSRALKCSYRPGRLSRKKW